MTVMVLQKRKGSYRRKFTVANVESYGEDLL